MKNQRRWTFGGVYPRGPQPRRIPTTAGRCAPSACSRARPACASRSACGSCTSSGARCRAWTRRAARSRSTSSRSAAQRHLTWDEATEREVSLPERSLAALRAGGTCPSTCRPVVRSRSCAATAAARGLVARSWHGLARRGRRARRAPGPGLHRRVGADRQHDAVGRRPARGGAAADVLLGAHGAAGRRGGTFVSLTDPPEALAEAAAACRNEGTWPVLVGAPGDANDAAVLADHPRGPPAHRPREPRRPVRRRGDRPDARR